MLATSRLCAPLNVLYFSFIVFANAFSFDLSLNNGDWSSPFDGNSFIHTIKYVSIDTGLSDHGNSPCTQLTNNLTQIFISALLPKCGIYKTLKILVFSSLITHSYGSTMIAYEFGVSLTLFYLSGSNSRNFFISVNLWSAYLILPTASSISSSMITPSGIFGSKSLYFNSFYNFTYFAIEFLGGT
jgi:hypothetical protein